MWDFWSLFYTGGWCVILINMDDQKICFAFVFMGWFRISMSSWFCDEVIRWHLAALDSNNLLRSSQYSSTSHELQILRYSSNGHINICWTLDVSRTASYEVTLVRPSVCPSLSFLKVGSLVCSDIVHDDSWPWYLVTDEARFLKKKQLCQPEFGPNGPKSGPKLFLPFSRVWFISFPWNCIGWLLGTFSNY